MAAESRRLLAILALGALIAGACAPQNTPVVTGKDSQDPTWVGTQSETASTAARSGGQDIFVATYNDDTDNGLVKYTATDRVVYPGASMLGWSYSYDRGKTWTYGGKVNPPTGVAALWGDPAIVTSGTSYNRVYISSLAIGELPPEGHHGFLDDGSITGACIARSDDGGVHFAIQSCVSAKSEGSPKGDFYDGAAMAAAGGAFTNDTRVFAAYVDVPMSRIDVWASPDGLAPFQRLPDAFPQKSMVSHPRLAYDRSTGALLVAAIASDGYIYMNRLNGNQWQSPTLASNPTSRIDVNVGGQNIRAAYGFSFDVGTPSQTDQGDGTTRTNDDGIRLLYTTRDSQTKRLYVRGSACRFDLANCHDAPEWGTTPGNLNTPRDQWNPTVKAWPGFIGLPPEWKATYQTTDDTPSGVSIKQGNLAVLPNGTRVFLPFNLVPPRPVCPDYRYGSPGMASNGYWGDYDEMAMVGFSNSSAPEFLLAFSDSSKGCVSQSKFTSNHLHVSSVVFT